MLVIVRQDIHQLPDQVAQIEFFQPLVNRIAQKLADTGVVDEFQRTDQYPDRLVRQKISFFLGREPRGNPLRRFPVAHFGNERFFREEIVPDENGHILRDTVLVFRNDRCARNREVQWMPENRDDGEPVREGTDHGRLCKGADPFPDADTTV